MLFVIKFCTCDQRKTKLNLAIGGQQKEVEEEWKAEGKAGGKQWREAEGKQKRQKSRQWRREEGKDGATWISQVEKEGQIVSAKNKVKFSMKSDIV